MPAHGNTLGARCSLPSPPKSGHRLLGSFQGHPKGISASGEAPDPDPNPPADRWRPRRGPASRAQRSRVRRRVRPRQLLRSTTPRCAARSSAAGAPACGVRSRVSPPARRLRTTLRLVSPMHMIVGNAARGSLQYSHANMWGYRCEVLAVIRSTDVHSAASLRGHLIACKQCQCLCWR